MNFSSSGQSNDLLSNYPKLAAWYSQHLAKPPTISQLADYHVWSVAKALRSPQSSRSRLWCGAIDQIVLSTNAIFEHAIEADNLSTSLGVSLTELYSILAETAINHGEGPKAFAALRILADHTDLVAFRFLSAWTAFNIQNIPDCISECEKVNEAFAPIYTLLGQALLESGQPLEAIDSLKVAIELAPSDPLPVVQLIKAYLVTGIQSEAMRYVDRCRKILGPHIEIECLAAMAIMSGSSRNADFCERTLTQFANHLTNEPSDLEAYSLAMELATELKEKEWALKFSGLVDFSDSVNPLKIVAKISPILKKMGELHWHDLSRVIIDKTLILTRTNFADRTTQ